MDASAPTSMKSVANYDNYCELQNSANHQNLERKWRLQDNFFLQAHPVECQFYYPKTKNPLVIGESSVNALSWSVVTFEIQLGVLWKS